MRAPLPEDQTGESEDAEEVITEVLVEAAEDCSCAVDARVLGPKQVVSNAEDWFLLISWVSLVFTDFSYSRSA